ncbi:MAG: LCP family protein [Firmicutes bacterium]|nr:LCP family protein [Bacillota bacterium]
MRPISITRQKRRKKTRPNRGRSLFLLALILCVLVLFAGMRFLSPFRALQNRADWASKLSQASQTTGKNYLLYGLAKNGEEVAVEEMFLLNLPEKGDSSYAVFIPGKVLLHRLDNENGAGPFRVEENNDESEVRSFYTPTHFYREGGAELLIQQISLSLDAPIHHYMEFDYGGVSELLEAYKGVGSFKSISEKQDCFASLMHGENEEKHLEKALCRAGFLGDLLKFLTEKKGKLDLYRAISSIAPYLETDLSWKELRLLRKDLEPFFQAESMVVSLPGEWQEFGGELFLKPDNLQLAALSESLGEESILPRELITVEILNGCGIAGVASTAGSVLEEQGFNVIRVDNADNFEYRRSQVISRLEQIEPAKEVAQYIPEAELFKELQSDHAAMVTVIVGKNFLP